jgi:hypothetical protein
VLLVALIVGPILMPLGAVFFVAVLASVYATPVYVCVLFIEGHYVLAVALLAAWVFWLRSPLRAKLFCWMLEGFEWSSL